MREHRPASDTGSARELGAATRRSTASPWSAGFPLGAVYVRISVLALLCITPVVWFAASELPDSAPYYLWGGSTALVLAGAIAMLCRVGLSGGSSARSPGEG